MKNGDIIDFYIYLAQNGYIKENKVDTVTDVVSGYRKSIIKRYNETQDDMNNEERELFCDVCELSISNDKCQCLGDERIWNEIKKAK